MRDEPVAASLMKLGIPTMIGMLISALYNAIDAYFVSGLGMSQMGAVSVVFPIVQIVIGLGMMFGAGASSYISRLLGKGDNAEAQSNRLHRSFCQHFCRSGHYRRNYGIPQPCADVAGSDRHDFALCESLRPNLCDWLHHQCVYRHNEQPSDGAGCYPVHHDLYAHRQYHQHHFRPDYDLCPGLGH